jgi:hypothetical protein
MDWTSTGPALRAICLALLLSGCGDDDGGGDDGGLGDGGADAGPVDAGARDAGPPDAGGDGNDDFDGATSFTVDATPFAGVLEPAGDVDFYAFEGTEGDWLEIAVDADPLGEDAAFDSLLTLYDASRMQIARNDDTVPGVPPHSEILFHVPATGTYYVRVEDLDDPPIADLRPYELTIATLNTGKTFITEDREAGDDAASAVGVGFTSSGANLTVGTFRDTSDVDVYSVTLTTNARLTVYLMPWGADGHGSTTSAGNLWVTDMVGTEIIGRIDNRVPDWFVLNAPLPRGSYLLWVEHPGTVGGDNDFYAMKVFRSRTDNTPEAMEGTNDTLAGAEMLSQSTDPVRAAFILADLPDGDVDYFSFEVLDGEVVTAACGANTSGSGVRDLSMEIRDASDTMLVSATEAPPSNAFISDAMITAAGTYYLRLAKGSQDPEVTGTWVRCAVRASIP